MQTMEPVKTAAKLTQFRSVDKVDEAKGVTKVKLLMELMLITRI